MPKINRTPIWFIEDYFKGWNAFEIALLISAVVVPVSLGLIFSSAWIKIVASSSTLIMSLLFAKAKIEGYFVAILSITTFVIVAWGERLFGEVIIQLIFVVPMSVIGFFIWLKDIRINKSTGHRAEIVICKKSAKELSLTAVTLALLGVGFYFILQAFETQFLFVSTLSVVTALGGLYLIARKSYWGPFVFALNDIVQITLWAMVLVTTRDMGFITVLSLPSMLLLNDIYGTIKWRKMYYAQKAA